jgi:hypothetical protein
MRNSVVPIVKGREIVRHIKTPTPKYPGSAREIGGLKGKVILHQITFYELIRRVIVDWMINE